MPPEHLLDYYDLTPLERGLIEARRQERQLLIDEYDALNKILKQHSLLNKPTVEQLLEVSLKRSQIEQIEYSEGGYYLTITQYAKEQGYPLNKGELQYLTQRATRKSREHQFVVELVRETLDGPINAYHPTVLDLTFETV